MKPAELQLPIDQGGSIDRTFRFYFDATGLSAYAEVWNKNNTQKLLDLTTTWLTRSETGSWVKSFAVNGVIQTVTYTVRSSLRISATPTQTALIKEDGFWDLLLQYPDGSRFYQMRGPAPIRIRATRGPALP
jgi:P pilus assembly chaperone PapD